MNKKEAVAYAQITLNHMLGPKYDGEINLDIFAVEMRQSFRLYPKNIVLTIADAQSKARQKLQLIKNGCDINE